MLRVWKIEDALEDNSQWTKEDKLKKSATDLLETEAEYIRVRTNIIKICVTWFESNMHYRHIESQYSD